jgi:hypothetical protein
MSELRRSTAATSHRPVLVSIPTHVVLEADNPELVGAWVRLVRQRRRDPLYRGDDALEANGEARWRYLCSAPYREDDGRILYVHVFRHECHAALDAPMTLGVPATRGWWPKGERSLSPRRAGARPRLRLVR